MFTLYFLTIIISLLNIESSIIGKIGHESGSQKQGMCECAAFPSDKIKSDDKPLFKNNPLNFTCPTDDTCKNLCIALTKAAKAQGPFILCATIDHIDDLKVSIFTRSCDKEWEYTNLTSPEAICCHNKAPVTCKNTTASPIPLNEKVDDPKQ